MKRRFTGLVVLAATLGLAAAGCGRYSISNIRALKAFGDANKLYSKQDFRGAIDGYEATIAFDPQPPVKGFAYFFLGNSYDNLFKPARKTEPGMMDNLTQAVANYKLAIQNLQGDLPDEARYRKLSYEYLIAAYGSDKLNDLAQAEPIAQQLIALEPNEPQNYEALGLLYEEAKRFDDAERNFKKAVDVKPNDPNVYVTLAGFYNRQGNKFEQTMQALANRARVEPNNPDAFHTIATYYQDEAYKDHRLTLAQKKDYTEKGLQAEDRALALNPDYAEAMIYKNILLRMKANYTPDPAQQKALIKEADDLQAKGIELQKKHSSDAAGAGRGGN